MGQTLSCGSSEGHRLCAAVRDQDVDIIESLARVDSNALNKAVNHERQTPLHLASSLGHVEVCLVLLKHGANPNSTNNRGQTPLMLACKSGKWTCIDPLLQHDANVLAFDKVSGRTCLHHATREGHIECVRKIIGVAKTGPIATSWGFVRFLNVRDAYGATPLHLAARGGHISVVKHLLENGALVSATTTTTGNSTVHGSTPLHFAARSGSMECVRELLAWGAERNVRDVNGYSPYGIALKYKNTACAALLNPNAAEPLVWPSPWKFISELNPQAKLLLEEALAQANSDREKALLAHEGLTISTYAKGEENNTNTDDTSNDQDPDEVRLERSDSNGQEVCCICFEQVCTIEVQDCGHQMCAACTLALCCHNKPNPSVRVSPPPACPFCRQDISQLVVAKPKTASCKSKSRWSRKISSIDLTEKGSFKISLNKESSGTSSFRKLVGKENGAGSFRKVVSRSTSKGSGRIADVDWLNRCQE